MPPLQPHRRPQPSSNAIRSAVITLSVAQSEIIADNRLGRLANSITYHENKKEYNSTLYRMPLRHRPQMDINTFPDEHKNSKRCLSQ